MLPRTHAQACVASACHYPCLASSMVWYPAMGGCVCVAAAGCAHPCTNACVHARVYACTHACMHACVRLRSAPAGPSRGRRTQACTPLGRRPARHAPERGWCTSPCLAWVSAARECSAGPGLPAQWNSPQRSKPAMLRPADPQTPTLHHHARHELPQTSRSHASCTCCPSS